MLQQGGGGCQASCVNICKASGFGLKPEHFEFYSCRPINHHILTNNQTQTKVLWRVWESFYIQRYHVTSSYQYGIDARMLFTVSPRLLSMSERQRRSENGETCQEQRPADVTRETVEQSFPCTHGGPVVGFVCTKWVCKLIP